MILATLILICFLQMFSVLTGNQHFLLFPQCFLPCHRQKTSLKLHLFFFPQMFSVWSNQKFRDKNLIDQSKFEEFANDKLSVAKMLISVFNRVENIVGKVENADYQHFLLFP